MVSLSLLTVLLMGFTPKDKEKTIELPGNYFKAWMVCHGDFEQINNMSDEQKMLDNYMIKITENDIEYSIEYIPKLLTDPEIKRTNRMTLGRNIKYIVNKNTMKITEREFYK